VKRIGVIGTMVWDTIHGRDPNSHPVEEWGGIAYALSSFEASLPSDWEIVPLIKVGKDLTGRANEFLGTLTHRSAAGRFVEVPEPNNRVTLRYTSESRRGERLTGGVPGWSWAELGPMVTDLDALYVNFISGYELSLETATFLRHGYSGPIYADLHSLLLGVGVGGFRTPQPLEEPVSWYSCFDAVQANEDEMQLLGEDPMAVSATALAHGVKLMIVTLGSQGAVYFGDSPIGAGISQGPVKTARIPIAPYLENGDPTGCGDVFGSSLFARLLTGDNTETAISHANQQARRNLMHRGATNLHYHLRGEIAPR
jgi:hypothetical protein